MHSKHLLIAIAAFAVTATGAQAYIGSDRLTKAGLSTAQVEAFSEARELRMKGKVKEAKDRLLKAGVNEDTIKTIRQAARESHQRLVESVESGDYKAFKEAVSGTPLADIITTENDFLVFREAHILRQEGNFAEAKEMLDDLGVENTMKGYLHKRHAHRVLDLTPEQQDALRAARQANDQETVEAILSEAGIVDLFKHKRPHRSDH